MSVTFYYINDDPTNDDWRSRYAAVILVDIVLATISGVRVLPHMFKNATVKRNNNAHGKNHSIHDSWVIASR